MTLERGELSPFPHLPEHPGELGSSEQLLHYSIGALSFLMFARDRGITIQNGAPLLTAIDHIHDELQARHTSSPQDTMVQEALDFHAHLTEIEDTEGVGAQHDIRVVQNEEGMIRLRTERTDLAFEADPYEMLGLPRIEDPYKLTSDERWDIYTAGSLAFLIAAREMGLSIENGSYLSIAFEEIGRELDRWQYMPEHQRDSSISTMINYLDELDMLEDFRGVSSIVRYEGINIWKDEEGRLSLYTRGREIASEAPDTTE
jgi:hypothetical protein